MFLSVRQKRKFKISLYIILSGIGLGLFYALLSDGFVSWFPFINGAIVGFLIGLIISTLELQVLDNKIRQLRFISLVLLRTCLYVIFIPIVILFELMTARVIKFDLSYKQVYNSTEFQNYLLQEDFLVVIVYTMGLSLLVNFIYQISRKMGQGMLWSYVTGRYKTPVKEDRIFMFMHITNAKEIVNDLGSMRFLEFLNQIFFDITSSILLYKGVIYEYVEDECVVSWRLEHGIKNANCLQSVSDIFKKIEKRKDFYRANYGMVPVFEAALHCGPVLCGEVGSLKTEIAFYGDVMNITARILSKCTDLGKSIVISQELFEKLIMPLPYELEFQGEFELKGKSKPIELLSITTPQTL